MLCVANYADRWAQARNPIYASVAIAGDNDCTNFASQAVAQGGLRSNTAALNWYFNGASYFASWNGVAALYGQFTKAPNGYLSTVCSPANRPMYNDAQVGDLMFFDWTNDGVIDHAAIEVGWNSTGDQRWASVRRSG